MQEFIDMGDHLKAVFTFGDFVEAIDFVNQVADAAIEVDHHPDICLHDYKNVTVILTTHDAGKKVTEKDWNLAVKIKQLLED